MELGPPDSIYRKSDRRLSIHKKDRRASDISADSGAAFSPDDPVLSEHGSVIADDDGDDGWEDMDEEAEEEAREREVAAAEHFYNYYHHGFDILISQPPTYQSPSLPGREGEFDGEGGLAALPRNYLTATKVILHGNIPGSYQFNRHRRSRWVIELPKEPLTSEMPYDKISSPLKKEFKSYYANEEEEQAQQRGMALNRGWGDSPSSSIELLGGWDEGEAKKGKSSRSGLAASEGEAEVGKATLFGFPGLIFEVLANGAVCALTVY
jgi:hypothetical protein